MTLNPTTKIAGSGSTAAISSPSRPAGAQRNWSSSRASCTRFSIDFRTVNLDDLVDGAAAPNIDSECTGTTLPDFLRATDLEPLPEDVIAMYDKRPGVAVAAR